MATIGVYDSGIGGLTTLVQLERELCGNDFYYLADNLNMPFGSKSDSEMEDIVSRGIKKLEAHSDISILACNTASVITASQEVFKLLPRLEGLDPSDTLVIATPLTLSHLKAKENFYNTADTSELAALIEIQAGLCYKSRKELDMRRLGSYLKRRLGAFSDVKNVVLGCSHYPYVLPELKKIFRSAAYYDGNPALLCECKSFLPKGLKRSKTEFGFTGSNETEKYAYIYEKLQKTMFFQH